MSIEDLGQSHDDQGKSIDGIGATETGQPEGEEQKKYTYLEYSKMSNALFTSGVRDKVWDEPYHQARKVELQHHAWLKELKTHDSIRVNLAMLKNMSEQEYNQQSAELAGKMWSLISKNEYKAPETGNRPAIIAKLVDSESFDRKFICFDLFQNDSKEPQTLNWLDQGYIFSNLSADERKFANLVATKGVVDDAIKEVNWRERERSQESRNDRRVASRNKQFLEGLGIDLKKPKFFSDNEKK